MNETEYAIVEAHGVSPIKFGVLYTLEVYEAVRANHPQERWGTPEDAARLISWLVTDDAAWITGPVINSRGGA